MHSGRKYRKLGFDCKVAVFDRSLCFELFPVCHKGVSPTSSTLVLAINEGAKSEGDAEKDGHMANAKAKPLTPKDDLVSLEDNLPGYNTTRTVN